MKKDFTVDDYFKRLYDVYSSPYENAKDAEACLAVSSKLICQLEDIMAIDKIPFKCEKIEAEVIKTVKRKNYTVETLSAEICKSFRMLCHVLIPDKKDGSAVLALCGHGYGSRQIIRQSKSGKYRKINFLDNYQKNFAEALAAEGKIVIVPEFVGFGQARLKKDIKKPFYASSCDTVSHHALLYGFSTASLRIFQAMKCVDILKEKYFCQSIGCMGISGGGLVALYTACLDERIEKTCVCGYINTFKTSVLSRWHCPDNYIPGLLRAGEMYDFASTLAPRKLMMQCGEKDKLFPIDGSRIAIERIGAVYETVGAKENFRPVIFGGKHEVFLEAAIEFFK